MNALWLDTNPSLKRFHRPLLNDLARRTAIARWEYQQSPDEGSTLAEATTLLHDFLQSHDRPIHLLGHSTGGLLGLAYARRHPDRVRSLTLLAIGPHAAVNWQAHYYALRELLPCSRSVLLAQMARLMFGGRGLRATSALVDLLDRDLCDSLALHSPLGRKRLNPAPVPVPLLVCGSEDDAIVDPRHLAEWESWFDPGDRLWICPEGRHFFHARHAERVGREIGRFWADLGDREGDGGEVTWETADFQAAS